MSGPFVVRVDDAMLERATRRAAVVVSSPSQQEDRQGTRQTMRVKNSSGNLSQDVEQLVNLIASSRRIVPFTVAGISTECGIRDFRSPGGLWTRHRPINYDEFVASQEARNEAWARRFAMAPVFAEAKPGRGHRALASLYKAGKIPGVLTQNIDNLHQSSGVAAKAV